ncbi:hypothetical protein NEHOM01_1239 [Nematocida homosporus]|uniref:uncharacterized protein n=1 Tax=Nematocida homosporus TaxID=1912981 RepID=UPI00221F6464|nr:uncharacterized protein NEHOM01_1239 [Nematocida homosporus]KAI5186036.1 hypothetical protein NEHOM01_1239 [Nematocida homosporus]
MECESMPIQQPRSIYALSNPSFLFCFIYSILNFTYSISIHNYEVAENKFLAIKDEVYVATQCSHMKTLSASAKTSSMALDAAFFKSTTLKSFFSGVLTVYLLLMVLKICYKKLLCSLGRPKWISVVYAFALAFYHLTFYLIVVHGYSHLGILSGAYYTARFILGGLHSFHTYYFGQQLSLMFPDPTREHRSYINLASIMATISGSLSIVCVSLSNYLFSPCTSLGFGLFLVLQTVLATTCILWISFRVEDKLCANSESKLLSVAPQNPGLEIDLQLIESSTVTAPNSTSRVKKWLRQFKDDLCSLGFWLVVLWPVVFFMSGVNGILFSRSLLFTTDVVTWPYLLFLLSPLLGSLLALAVQRVLSHGLILYLGACVCLCIHLLYFAVSYLHDPSMILYNQILLSLFMIAFNFSFVPGISVIPIYIGGRLASSYMLPLFYTAMETCDCIFAILFPIWYSYLDSGVFLVFALFMFASLPLIYISIKASRSEQRRKGVVS